MGILASTAGQQWPIEREYMPLLTELLALPPRPFLDEMLCRQGVELHRFQVCATGAAGPSAWSDPTTKRAT